MDLENIMEDKSWRDTLEKRTEEFKPSIEEANRLAQEFKPFISIEDNQEQKMKQDNGWFDRGELPPVGEVVTLNSINPNNYWAHHVGAELTIVSHDKDTRGTGIAVYRIVDRDGFNEYHGLVAHAFRPIRTERDKSIEDIAKIICKSGLRIDYFKDVAVAIYDAGYRKEQD